MNATGSTNYFIKTDDDSQGPLTAEQVRLRIMEKGLVASDLVRRDDEELWVPLGSKAEFQSALEVNSEAAQERKPYLMVILSLLMVVSPFGFAWLSDIPRVREDLGPLMTWLVISSWIMGIVVGHVVVSESKIHKKGIGFRLAARTVLAIGYGIPIATAFSYGRYRIHEPGYQSGALGNGRQVLMYLRIYASDHNGKYPDTTLPDARTSNDVFRQLFKEEIADSEMVFSGVISPYKADGNIGTEPDFNEAVKAGENHWAMTKGITEDDPDKMPLIFENPSEATWPPKWNADFAKQPKPGRTWSKGRIIVGFKDGSVELLPLESDRGTSVGLKPRADGTPIFPVLPGRKLEVLNVAK